MDSRIAGQVATPREHNLRNYARFARRDPDLLLGLDPAGSWTEAEVLALLARRCGVSPDPARRQGQDTIDPELTIRALDAMAAVLRETAAARGRVLLGTGHPSRLLLFYRQLAAGLRAAGCALLTPARGQRFAMHAPEGARPARLDYVDDVGLVRVYEGNPPIGAPGSAAPDAVGSATPVHTHSPQPVRIALAALAESGHNRPDLLIGDHGWPPQWCDLWSSAKVSLPSGWSWWSTDPGVWTTPHWSPASSWFGCRATSDPPADSRPAWRPLSPTRPFSGPICARTTWVSFLFPLRGWPMS